jgi:protein ImuB
MSKRYVSIYFRHLLTDWLTIRRPELAQLTFVVGTPDHGRLVITATNSLAENQGITAGMVVADAKALIPELEVINHMPGKELKLLKAIGEWCIRYAPIIAVQEPDGLILDVSGCTHLWGGEKDYLQEIINRLKNKGYDVSAAMADTAGTAWGIARYGKIRPIIEPGAQLQALADLPPDALRLEPVILAKLHKLGLRTVGSFINMQRSALRRRFGKGLLSRLDQALGLELEPIQPLQAPEPYVERLPCLEPIRTATGIAIAIQKLLEATCSRLQQEGLGLRTGILKCYRVDGKMIQIQIGTHQASHHAGHLFKLFELKIAFIAPGLGIELFILEVPKVDEVSLLQEALWTATPNLETHALTELLDRLAGKVGADKIHRYLPVAHYWPERAIKLATSIQEKPAMPWRSDKPRPVQVLASPERIQVTAPIPDYPPMLFIYKGKTHYIRKADGPERIEREWWLDKGEHRDYYYVEDENGQRYWLFRSGHYAEQQSQWFIHGFFA